MLQPGQVSCSLPSEPRFLAGRVLRLTGTLRDRTSGRRTGAVFSVDAAFRTELCCPVEFYECHGVAAFDPILRSASGVSSSAEPGEEVLTWTRRDLALLSIILSALMLTTIG